MNDEQEVRVGVIGCGIMGRKHSLNLSRMEKVSVVAVVDTDMAKAVELGSEINVAAYDNTKKMLNDITIDAAIVATPPAVRCEIVRAVSDAGIATFVEKPIALNLDTARVCYDAVKEDSIVNAVGFQLRYAPLTQQAQRLISGRSVTHVRTACTTPYYLAMDVPHWYLQREYSGGPLLEQSIHVFDMARYMVGEITNVFAHGDYLVCPNLDTFDSEDTIILAYRFANGTLGTHIDSCAMKEFNWEIELFGPNWRLLVDYARNKLSGQLDGDIIEQKLPDEDLHMLEMQTFIKAVRYPDNNGILSDFTDAIKTLAVVLAGDRSMRTDAWESVSV